MSRRIVQIMPAEGWAWSAREPGEWRHERVAALALVEDDAGGREVVAIVPGIGEPIPLDDLVHRDDLVDCRCLTGTAGADTQHFDPDP